MDDYPLSYEEALGERGVYISSGAGKDSQIRYVVENGRDDDTGNETENRMIYVGFQGTEDGQLQVVTASSFRFRRAPEGEQRLAVMFGDDNGNWRFSHHYGEPVMPPPEYLSAPPPPADENSPTYLMDSIRFDREYREWYARLQRNKG